MELVDVPAVGLVALGAIDLVLIAVCGRLDAKVEELRKALAASTGQHEGRGPALETTAGAAGPDAPAREGARREPQPAPTPAPRVVSPAALRRKLERQFAERARDAETLRKAAEAS